MNTFHRSISCLLPLALTLVSGVSAQQSYPSPTANEQTMFEQVVGKSRAAQTAPADSSALAPGSLPQSAGVVQRLPSFGQMVSNLREGAMGVVEGCDYAKYLELANQIAENSGLLKNLSEDWGRRFATPVLDGLNTVTRLGQTVTTEKAADAEAQNVGLALEQTCNAVKQADETNRQLQIIQAGRVNIGKAVSWMSEEVALKLFPDSGNADQSEKKQRVTVDFDRLYTFAPVENTTRGDASWASLNESMRHTLSLTEQYSTSLGTMGEQLAQVEEDLWLLATHDSVAGRWTCPQEAEYPDVNDLDVQERLGTRGGVPICGPATPERSTQVAAHIAYQSSHIRTLEIKILNQLMQVEAVRLMAENHVRKVDERAASTVHSRF